MLTGCATAAGRTESQELLHIRELAGTYFDRGEAVSGSYIPVPYLFAGPSLMGGGYAPVACRVEGGLSMDATNVIFQDSAAYDDGHKVDDGDQPNPKGHDRYMGTALYFRPARPGWTRELYFGGGYRWGQLSPTNYTKTSRTTSSAATIYSSEPAKPAAAITPCASRSIG